MLAVQYPCETHTLYEHYLTLSSLPVLKAPPGGGTKHSIFLISPRDPESTTLSFHPLLAFTYS